MHTKTDRGIENTVAGLKFARDLGVGAEMDTWRLAGDDGSLGKGISVIFHDYSLCPVVSFESLAAAGLTCNNTMSQVTYQQFVTLRTKANQPLMTLERAINFCARYKMKCKVEIHMAPNNLSAVADQVKAKDGLRYISFYQLPRPDQGCTTRAVTTLQSMGISGGVKYAPERCKLTLKQFSQYDYVTISPSNMSTKFIRQLHSVGVQVGSHNTRSPSVWKNMVNMNADFILAPNPDDALTWLRG